MTTAGHTVHCWRRATWSEPAGPLGLWVACPNRRAEEGDNRDKFVLNPILDPHGETLLERIRVMGTDKERKMM